MTSASSLFRSLVIYGLCLPLAVFLGYLLANPYALETYAAVGVVLMVMLIPLLLRWHHIWLVATWNSTMVLYFLPGKPGTWSVLAWAGLLIGTFQYILDRRQKFLFAPNMTKALLFLVVVVLVTAKATGGMGMKVMGGDAMGGKRYLLILSGVAGYFALTCQRIPPNRALLAVGLFFFGAVTIVLGDLGEIMGAVFRPIFAFFPVGRLNVAQSIVDLPGGQGVVHRAIFLGPAGAGMIYLLLARHGIREIFAWNHPIRLMTFLGCFGLAMLGGYRSMFIMIFLTFAVVFYLEGLVRSPLLPIFFLAGILAVTALAPFASYLPPSFQRSLAILPLPVSEDVRLSAQGSTEWRLGMWNRVLPEIPEHLWLGKGYIFSGSQLYDVVNLSDRVGTGSFEMVGDYHNGPLSVIIPFGIWGVIAYIWFLVAALRILRRNLLWGDPTLHKLNVVLLAYFVAKTVVFLGVAGGFYTDFYLMSGVIGLSISINGGVAQPAPTPALKTAPRRLISPRSSYKPASA